MLDNDQLARTKTVQTEMVQGAGRSNAAAHTRGQVRPVPQTGALSGAGKRDRIVSAEEPELRISGQSHRIGNFRRYIFIGQSQFRKCGPQLRAELI